MKNSKNFILFLGILFFVSCQNNIREKEEYVETKKNFPPELVSHFPDQENLQKDFTSQIFYQSEYSPLQFLVKQTESNSTIDSLISNSTKIQYSDTSYYIVNKYLRTENLLAMPGKFNEFDDQKFFQNAVPIPNFYRLPEFREDTFHHLSKDFSIFIRDTKPIKCCSNKLHKGEWHMPIEWKDGFSKGYAINEHTHTVIYWFVIW